MGEIADDDYDRIMDSEWGFYRASFNYRSPTCRLCGLWLRWHLHQVGWRLTNPDNTIHLCQAVASVDEFDVVTSPSPTHDEFGNPL